MRYPATILALLLASPVAAQDAPARPEPADHAAMPADEHAAHDAEGDTSSEDPQPEVRLISEKTELLPGYGTGGFAITTDVPEAQAFFSNGLELNAAFDHHTTIAAMKEAVRLDPACAMCLWGEALVSGPTLNFGKDADERKPLLVLAKQAERLARKRGTDKERALTAALVERYRAGDIAKRDIAYAAAMQRIQSRFPDDHEIAVLTADAMALAAFSQEDEEAALAELKRTLPLLEGVLAEDPDHTPAIHFYIHFTEVLGEPEKAEPYADRLARLAPNASHLVHMPAHTWYWTGRYAEAAQTNRDAVEVGKANALRLGMTHDMAWSLPYHAHNVIYGLGGALMAGDSAVGLDLARPLLVSAEKLPADARVFPQLLMSSAYFAMARFDPASVADLPEPAAPYLKAAWQFARGEAAAWNRDIAGVRAAHDAIPESIAEDPDSVDPVAAEQMLGILRGVLAGRAATLEGDLDAAAAAYRSAAEIEETPSFNRFTDPPAFRYPVRRDLAATLLAAGDAAGAKAAAEKSLHLRKKDPVATAVLAGAEAALAVRR